MNEQKQQESLNGKGEEIIAAMEGRTILALLAKQKSVSQSSHGTISAAMNDIIRDIHPIVCETLIQRATSLKERSSSPDIAKMDPQKVKMIIDDLDTVIGLTKALKDLPQGNISIVVTMILMEFIRSPRFLKGIMEYLNDQLMPDSIFTKS